MNKVDWSLAPRWAEYVVVGPLSGFNYWANDNRRIQFCGDFDCCDDNHVKEGWDVVEEKPQSKPWSGPQDGLPPIGMTVQVWDKEPHKFYAKHIGKSVEILAHRIGNYGDPVAVYCFKEDDGTDGYHALVEECFRPVQHLEDKRETAIREIMDIADVDCRVTAARLVDAGFKREVV
jgi:hypothetical protein